jgi:inorganic pyrophosphatase
MTNLTKLPVWSEKDVVHAVVETPRGARAKLKYEPALRVFMLSKALMLGLSYPFDWGFIPSTIAEDGDPLDVMIIHDAATFPGLVLKCRVIGVLQVLQRDGRKRERNDRIMAVPMHCHLEEPLDDARKLPRQVQQELEKFFMATDELESKTLEFLGWKGPAAATRLIQDGARKFVKQA